MKKLSKKSRILLDKLNTALALLKKSKDKKVLEATDKLEEELNFFLDPRKSKLFKLKLKKKAKKRRKIFRHKDGVDPKIIAMRQNGQKGGLKTAATHSLEERQEWTRKAGNTTLARYGRDFYKYIRSKRKDNRKNTRYKRRVKK